MAVLCPEGSAGKRPLFVINPKCVAFSVMVVALFFARPPACLVSSKVNLALATYSIFLLAYSAMAWYDHFYNCDPLRGGGLLSLSAAFKPEETEEDHQDPKTSRSDIAVFHVLLIVPWLAWVVWKGQEKNSPAVALLAVFTALYHFPQLRLG